MEAGSVVFEKYRSTRSVRFRIVFPLLHESASTIEIRARLVLKTGDTITAYVHNLSLFLFLENCFFFALIDLKLLKLVEFSKKITLKTLRPGSDAVLFMCRT